MGRLNLQNTAGFNAGNNYVVKLMRVSDIVIDPEISKIFEIQEPIRYLVANDIKDSGFDKSQPLTIWKGTGFLLDGHTRLSAAIEAGLEEVPVVEKEFDSRDAAIWYTIVRQALRRSLTPVEILKAVEMLPEERNRKGEGSLAGQLAEMLGLNASTVYDAKKILREATPEVIEKVKNKEMSFKAASRNPTGKTTESIPSLEPLPKKDPVPKETTTIAISMVREIENNVLTAHAKIGSACDLIKAFNFIETSEEDKPLGLLKDAMELLETVESGLARLY
jgi:hypothetical protein